MLMVKIWEARANQTIISQYFCNHFHVFNNYVVDFLSMEFKYYLNFIYELILLSIGITSSTGSTSIRNGWYNGIYILTVALGVKIDELRHCLPLLP